MADNETPLSKSGNQTWRFLVLIGSIAAAIMFIRSEVFVVAAQAAEERAVPLRVDLDALKKQNAAAQEDLKTMQRNVYRLCLASRVKDCEP